MPGCVKRLLIIAAVILTAVFFLRSFIRGHYVAPIIMYHYVHPNPDAQDRLTVTPRSFEAQMRFLKEGHYNVVPLETLGFLIRDKKKIPDKTVSITIDDGHRDCFSYIYPVLKKYNLPATLFIIVDEVGRLQGDRISWGEIREMRDSGLITFGSHALGPEPLVNIKSETELRKQIFDSKRILEEKLGVGVGIFSYPEGHYNDKIKQLIAEAGYKLAVTTMPKGKHPDDDALALKRLRISSSSDNLLVFWFETSGIYTFIRERDKDRR